MNTTIKQAATTSYPFLSKNQIKDRLAHDLLFVADCAQIMQERQTAYEQATLTTKDRNRQGWMSSHAVNGGKLTAKIRNGEEISAEEVLKLQEMVSHYGKQLASHFRALAVEENPALKATAAIFGV